MNAATPTTLLLLSALYAACIYVDNGTTVAGVAGRLKDAEKGRKHYFKNELHLRDRVDLNSCQSGGIVPIRHVAYKNKRKKND